MVACPDSPVEAHTVEGRRGMPGNWNRGIGHLRQHIPGKAANAVVPDPALVSVNHGKVRLASFTGSPRPRTVTRNLRPGYWRTASAAAVRASCEEIWVQSRSPRMKAPVGQLVRHDNLIARVKADALTTAPEQRAGGWQQACRITMRLEQIRWPSTITSTA